MSWYLGDVSASLVVNLASSTGRFHRLASMRRAFDRDGQISFLLHTYLDGSTGAQDFLLVVRQTCIAHRGVNLAVLSFVDRTRRNFCFILLFSLYATLYAPL